MGGKHRPPAEAQGNRAMNQYALNTILTICYAANETVVRGYDRYDRRDPRAHEIAVRNIAERLATGERLGVARVANDDGPPRATHQIAGGVAFANAVEGTTASRRVLTKVLPGEDAWDGNAGRRFCTDELGLVTFA